MRVDRHLSGPIRFTGIPDQASNRCSQACDSAPAVSRATRKERQQGTMIVQKSFYTGQSLNGVLH
jgi:hypothetical protein